MVSTTSSAAPAYSAVMGTTAAVVMTCMVHASAASAIETNTCREKLTQVAHVIAMEACACFVALQYVMLVVLPVMASFFLCLALI